MELKGKNVTNGATMPNRLNKIFKSS